MNTQTLYRDIGFALGQREGESLRDAAARIVARGALPTERYQRFAADVVAVSDAVDQWTRLASAYAAFEASAVPMHVRCVRPRNPS